MKIGDLRSQKEKCREYSAGIEWTKVDNMGGGK
jgi:hypothetical protein